MTAASSPEDSGTAAPDPRTVALTASLRHLYVALGGHEQRRAADDILTDLDAADRAAGVIRVRVDEQVEKLARAIYSACHPADHYRESLWRWNQQNEPRRELHRRQARAVLEALVTP